VLGLLAGSVDPAPFRRQRNAPDWGAVPGRGSRCQRHCHALAIESGNVAPAALSRQRNGPDCGAWPADADSAWMG
jgi:hypothetical protein